MRSILVLSLVLLGACGSITAPEPVTGQYTAANAATLSIAATSGYAFSLNHQLAENGTWTRNGTILTLTASSSGSISTLTVGSGTLDGFVYGSQRHFTRTGP